MLFHDAIFVKCHGPYGHIQQPAHFLHTAAFRQQLQNLSLPEKYPRKDEQHPPVKIKIANTANCLDCALAQQHLLFGQDSRAGLVSRLEDGEQEPAHLAGPDRLDFAPRGRPCNRSELIRAGRRLGQDLVSRSDVVQAAHSLAQIVRTARRSATGFVWESTRAGSGKAGLPARSMENKPAWPTHISRPVYSFVKRNRLEVILAGFKGETCLSVGGWPTSTRPQSADAQAAPAWRLYSACGTRNRKLELCEFRQDSGADLPES